VLLHIDNITKDLFIVQKLKPKSSTSHKKFSKKMVSIRKSIIFYFLFRGDRKQKHDEAGSPWNHAVNSKIQATNQSFLQT
jgi:hypothetical protein